MGEDDRVEKPLFMLIPIYASSAIRPRTWNSFLAPATAYRLASINSAIRKGSRRAALAGERGQVPSSARGRWPAQQDKRRNPDYDVARQSLPERRASATSRRFDAQTSKYEYSAQGNRFKSEHPILRGFEHERRAAESREALRSPSSRGSEPDPAYGERGSPNTAQDRFIRSNGRQRLGDAHAQRREREKGRWEKREELSRIDQEDEVSGISSKTRRQLDPISIPYTTPASEFLYGTSVVKAALIACRRKLYTLYIYTGENRIDLIQDRQLRKLAASMNINVRQVRGDWLRVMDKMSKGRPHNGYILEASPLPQLPVRSLQSVDEKAATFELVLDHQSREDAEVNGKLSEIRCQTHSRKPVVLLLDGIMDPGNLGNILRTAYFFGIDAVAISRGSNAPLGSVAQKASSGATENLQILSITDPGKFIEQSQENGWKFYAGVAPSTRTRRQNYISSRTLRKPAKDQPCVLMLGGEGDGLRSFLQAKADGLVGIEGDRLGRGGVDSLNVSVAAGIMCDAFCQSHEKLAGGRSESEERNRQIELSEEEQVAQSRLF